MPTVVWQSCRLLMSDLFGMSVLHLIDRIPETPLHGEIRAEWTSPLILSPASYCGSCQRGANALGFTHIQFVRDNATAVRHFDLNRCCLNHENLGFFSLSVFPLLIIEYNDVECWIIWFVLIASVTLVVFSALLVWAKWHAPGEKWMVSCHKQSCGCLSGRASFYLPWLTLWRNNST